MVRRPGGLKLAHGVTELAVNLFYPFLSMRYVSKNVLHALMAACFYIAIKFVA